MRRTPVKYSGISTRSRTNTIFDLCVRELNYNTHMRIIFAMIIMATFKQAAIE